MDEAGIRGVDQQQQQQQRRMVQEQRRDATPAVAIRNLPVYDTVEEDDEVDDDVAQCHLAAIDNSLMGSGSNSAKIFDGVGLFSNPIFGSAATNDATTASIHLTPNPMYGPESSKSTAVQLSPNPLYGSESNDVSVPLSTHSHT